MAATKMQGRGPPKGNIELFSPAYFAACGLGGILSCGPTHTGKIPLILHHSCPHRAPIDRMLTWNEAVTPLDLVRCPVQPDTQHTAIQSVPSTDIIDVSRSNVAVKSLLISTHQISPLGAASSLKKASAASFLVGRPPLSAIHFKAPANMDFMKSSSTITARSFFPMPTKPSSISGPLPLPNS